MNKGSIAIIAGSIAAIAAIVGVTTIITVKKTERNGYKAISEQTGIPYKEVKKLYGDFNKTLRKMKKDGASEDQMTEVSANFFDTIDKLASNK
jgi:hypothetical protein